MNTGTAPHIFISYRAQDEAATAVVGKLAAWLKEDLGRVRVFYAESDVPRGDDFLRHMQARMAEVSSVIVLIGTDWERHIADRARARAEDWVRWEIAAALARADSHVLPLLLNRRTSPDRDVLPEDVRGIATIRGLADFSLERDYHHVLFDVWTAYHRRLDPDVRFVVADETAEGKVVLERFLLRLEAEGALDVERFRGLSQHIAAPEGMAAIALTSLAKEFDGDVLLLEPDTIGEKWRRRRATIDGWVARHPTATVNIAAGNLALAATESVGQGPISWLRRIASWWDRATVTTKVGVGTVAAAATWAALPGGGVEATAFTYADIAYQTGDLDVVAHHPDADPEAIDDDPDTDYALLDLTIGNDLGVPTEALRYSRMPVVDTWSLEADNGRRFPAVGVLTEDYPWVTDTWGLLGVVEKDLRVVFAVESDLSLDNPVLHMSVNEMTPVVVPLDGSDIPIQIVDVTADNRSWEGPYSFGRARFELIEAWASFEAGRNDSTGDLYQAPESGFQRRAEEGFVFLHADIDVVGLEFGSSMVGGALIIGDHWIIADGEEYPAVADYFGRFGLQLPEEPERYHVIGSVPVTTSQVQLVVENSSTEGENYVIDVDPSFLDEFIDG